MKNSEKILEEWEALSEEIAETLAPDSSSFDPSPLKSPEQQRQEWINQARHTLEMKDYLNYLDIGMEKVLDYFPYLSSEQEKLVREELSKLGDSLSPGAISSNLSQPVASSFHLNEQVLNIIAEIGQLYLQKEAYLETASIYTLLALFDHTKCDYWFKRALALFFLEKYKEAEQSAYMAHLLSPGQPEFLLLLAKALHCLGEKIEAHTAWEHADNLIRNNQFTLPPEWAILYQDLKELQ